MGLLLGIDVGTSACRAALFAPDGTLRGQAERGYPVHYPAPGWAEQDPDDWWRGVCAAVQEALAAARATGRDVAGIGVDGQSWSAVPVSRQGRVLGRTPIWMDTRCAQLCRRVTERVGFERIFSVSGNAFEPTYSTPKMLWLKENQPRLYRETHQFLQSNSYIVFKLTGRFTQDLSQGYGVHAFNMARGTWDDGLCAELGLDREKLPPLFPCHAVVGGVTAEAAALTGLHPGTPVVAGGLDACCGTLGAGVVLAGQTQEQGGTAGGMSIAVDRPQGHPRLILGFHVVPGLWLLQGGTTGGGGALRWFRDELCAAETARAEREGRSAFALIDEQAASVPPGAGGLIFLPYMAGERSPLWDSHAKGVFFGLGYDKTRAHMARAVMEGCAFALLHNLRTAEEAGVTVSSLNAMGGAANSRVWTQIKADVTGKPFHVPRSDTATALGAALLAGVGIGQYKDFQEAVAATVPLGRTHEPDPALHRLYQPYYALYIGLYERLQDMMARLDGLPRPAPENVDGGQ